MPKDYYAEEIEGSKPPRDYYAEEVEGLKPVSEKFNPIDLLTSAMGIGAMGAAGYGAYRVGQPIAKSLGYVARGVSQLPKVVSTQKSSQLASNWQNEFAKVHERTINRFGKDLSRWTIKYPDRAVNLSEWVSELQTNPEISKEAIRVFQKTPVLENILKNPQSATSVPLKDAQKIVNHLQLNIPKNIRVNNFDILDGINTVKGAQIEAFPEMGQTRVKYQKFIEPYKAVKQYFRFNKTIPAITSELPPFGGAQGWEAVKKLLPEKVINQIKNYRAGERIARIPRKLPVLGRLFSIYPFIGDAIKYAQDPEAYMAGLETGGMAELEPKGSLERKIQLGQVI